METSRKAWINLLFFIVTLAVNSLGAIGLINGLSQKEISDMYLTLITPSPATFSIWSVIYSLLLISIIVMIVKKDDPYYKKAVDEITPLFRLSCLLNIAWIVTFSYVLIEISSLLILAFLITLALISLKLLKINDNKHWLLPVTFGMYTGWLFIATVVNLAATLVKLEWNGFGIAQDTWGVIILIVAILLVILVQIKLRNAVFPLPIAWAFFGIYQFLKAPEGFGDEYALMQNVALIGAGVLVLVALFTLYRNGWKVLPKTQES